MAKKTKSMYSNSQRTAESHLVINLLEPSLFGIVAYVFIFIVTVAISQPSQLKEVIKNLNSHNFDGTSLHRFFSSFNNIINSQITNDISIYIFWIIIAIVIYVIAGRIIKNVNEIADDVSIRKYIWPSKDSKNVPIRQTVEKIAFHIAMFIIIIFYFFKATPALFNLWKFYSMKVGNSSPDLGLIFVIFVFQTLYLHIAVILIRLFLTRTRIRI
jgi:hypothetical protein